MNRCIPLNGAQADMVYDISRSFDILGLAQTDISHSIKRSGKCGVWSANFILNPMIFFWTMLRVSYDTMPLRKCVITDAFSKRNAYIPKSP